jgi:hypothetical protein
MLKSDKKLMNNFEKSLNYAKHSKFYLSSLSTSGNTTPEWTTGQKCMMVLVVILSSFALGLSPIAYALVNTSTDNQTLAPTPMIGGNMF